MKHISDLEVKLPQSHTLIYLQIKNYYIDPVSYSSFSLFFVVEYERVHTRKSYLRIPYGNIGLHVKIYMFVNRNMAYKITCYTLGTSVEYHLGKCITGKMFFPITCFYCLQQ